MIYKDKARKHFEKYMGNLTLSTARLENGNYLDSRVENSWLDYLVGWTHCALLKADEERAKLLKQLADLRKLP